MQLDQSNLIFIFSLPRSGSTLLQRIIARDERVSAPSEPWILPALFNIRYGASPISEIAFDHVRTAIEDLYAQESKMDSEEKWAECIRAFAMTFYSGFFKKQHCLFVDKTPRNTMFLEQIIETFPKAKFILLFRNPLDVITSINNTFGSGRWKTYFYKIDLEDGLENLVRARERYQNDERFLILKYEDLVQQPKRQIELISRFTNLKLGDENQSIPKIDSIMGDKTGQDRFVRISSSTIDSWQSHFNSILRRFWIKQYTRKMKQKAAWPAEYSSEIELKPQSKQLINRFIFSDLFFMVGSIFYHRFDVMTTVRRILKTGKYARR